MQKYPRTPHLPWSEGATSDDKVLKSINHFVNQEVIVTEKLDGENTSIYPDGKTHARSLSSAAHPSRNLIRQFAAEIAYKIPPNIQIVGENLYAKHSIYYDRLPSYFICYGAFLQEDKITIALSWDELANLCNDLNIEMAPILYRGIWNEKIIKKLYPRTSSFGDVSEGYVIRTVAGFEKNNFDNHIAKFVRKGHVTTDEHWMHSQIIPNKLK